MTFKVEVIKNTASPALAKLGNLPGWMPMALDDIGAALVEKIRQGFRASESPYGQKWEPLKYRKGKPLLNTGAMRNSMTHAVDSANSVVIGTNDPKAPHHQYGTEGRKESSTRSQVLAFNRRGRFLSRSKASAAKSRVRVSFATMTFDKGSGAIPARPFLPMDGLPAGWSAVVTRVMTRHVKAIEEGAA